MVDLAVVRGAGGCADVKQPQSNKQTKAHPTIIVSQAIKQKQQRQGGFLSVGVFRCCHRRTQQQTYTTCTVHPREILV
jgi:hypothetical protein